MLYLRDSSFSVLKLSFMVDPLKIAVVQIDCAVGDAESNTVKAIQKVTEAAELQASVVLLPEISDLGYELEIVAKSALPLDKNPFFMGLCNLARTHKLSIISGIAERTVDGVFNSIIAIDANGELVSKYHKTHLATMDPLSEEKFLQPGEATVSTEIAGIKSGFMTCYEVRFPEIARKYFLEGVKIIYLPAAFPLVRIEQWDTLVKARAIENQIFVVAANRVGEDKPGLTLGGHSQIISPTGRVLAMGSDSEESVVWANIDLNEITKFRQQIKISEDRRTELYRA